MAKKSDAATLEWFGADREQTDGGRTTVTTLDSLQTKRGGPLRVKTSARDDRIAELTARFKLLRSAYEVAPPDDKAIWESRMNIAYCEMQLERFQQQLEKYRKRPDATPEQIEHYQGRIDQMRGRWLRLTGQEN